MPEADHTTRLAPELPALPEPDETAWEGGYRAMHFPPAPDFYTAEQMRTYAEESRLPLLAEIERLRTALAAQVQQPEDLARRFHEAYERLAPSFGYETRTDTKAFDPESPNGKLMIAVCSELTPRVQQGEPVAWQSMDKAPRDGTAVLVLLEGSDIPHAARWDAESVVWRLVWDGWVCTGLNEPLCWIAVPEVRVRAMLSALNQGQPKEPTE